MAREMSPASIRPRTSTTAIRSFQWSARSTRSSQASSTSNDVLPDPEQPCTQYTAELRTALPVRSHDFAVPRCAVFLPRCAVTASPSAASRVVAVAVHWSREPCARAYVLGLLDAPVRLHLCRTLSRFGRPKCEFGARSGANCLACTNCGDLRGKVSENCVIRRAKWGSAARWLRSAVLKAKDESEGARVHGRVHGTQKAHRGTA